MGLQAFFDRFGWLDGHQQIAFCGATQIFSNEGPCTSGLVRQTITMHACLECRN